MKDNLTENNDEKDTKRKENKSLEQSILDDIDAYEAENVKTTGSRETSEDKNQSSEISESAIEENKEAEEKSEKNEEPKQAIQAAASGESNYQINLINENLLRIRVKTKKGVNIDCSVKDTKSLSETQSNRLYLHPKPGEEIQEVEIIISIDPSTGELIVEKKKDENGQLIQPAVPGNLTPNPSVENLIMPVDLGRPDEPLIPLTEDELLQERIGKKNPFHLGRILYRRNMTIGIISAVLFACISALLFYNFYGKTDTKTIQPEQRLIILNDIPVKINFKEYEDPNKPKEEPKTEDGTDPTKITPPVVRNNIIRAPKINRPKINIPQDTSLTNDATKQLDSLRQLAAVDDSIRVADSLKALTNDYSIPDSLQSQLNDETFGLKMVFPKNWSLNNAGEINPNSKGVLLVDTAAGKGTINLFVVLDNEGNDYKAAEFKTIFPVNDSTITAYVGEPRTLAGYTTLKYYMFLKTDKLSISMQVKKQFYDQYKPIVDAMLKTISITPPSTPPK